MNFYPLKIDQAGIDFIAYEEKYRRLAYQDKVGRWTFGYGSTFWKDGSPVKKGDIIEKVPAVELLSYGAQTRANAVSHALRNPLNQNQQNAIISLLYNIGVGHFLSSTVLKLINQNQNDPKIEDAFMMWVKGTIDGKLVVLSDLVGRRGREVTLYQKPIG